ncbi:MAG: hypothetical protein ABIJ09_03590 [Pseudomonadota bacterium]
MGKQRSRTRPFHPKHTPGGHTVAQRASVRTDLPRFTPGGGLDQPALAQRVLESEDTEKVASGQEWVASVPLARASRRIRVTLPEDLVDALLERGDDEERSLSSMLAEAAVLWLEVTHD